MSVLPFDQRDGFIWMNGALVPWEDLPDGLRQANRAQADHIAIKRRTLEVSLVTVMSAGVWSVVQTQWATMPVSGRETLLGTWSSKRTMALPSSA